MDLPAALGLLVDSLPRVAQEPLVGVEYLREYAAMATILVVDDSLTERRLMGGWLERNGDFSVAYAADGQEALQWLRKNRVDLVLTDMQMPNMNHMVQVLIVNVQVLLMIYQIY